MKNRPLIPMGAITGKPSREQLRATLADYLDVGIDQFLIYPRSGLELEYMSEEWLEVCRHIIEYAAEHGMAIWLYDEYNWPSGKCAGNVIRHNDSFAAKRIDIFADGDFFGKALSTKLNLSYYWNVSSIPLYADVLSPEAVDCFINLTHAKYAEHFYQYFGTTIKGFFTDEPAAFYATTHKLAGSLLSLSYYCGLEEDYNALNGREFRKDVEQHLDGNPPKELWQDYVKLIGDRFRISFFDKVSDWCDRHGVVLTGHLMCEDLPFDSISANGNSMSALKTFGLPGIDEIWTHASSDKIVWPTFKMIENASMIKGTGGLAELFALGPSDMSLSRLRQMIWLAALHGIDHYVMAVSALDARGNIEKPYYYNPMNQAQPWFEAFRELGDEATVAARFATTNATFKMAVRYPQSVTIATELFTGKRPEINRLGKLLGELVQRQWQVRLIEENCKIIEDYEAVLALTNNGFAEEFSSSAFDNENMLCDWLETKFHREMQVIGAEGLPERDLILKSFDDGTACVLSLSQHSRNNLSLLRCGKSPVSFDLPAEGVFITSNNQEPEYYRQSILNLPDEPCAFELSSLNSMRAVFDENGEYCFESNVPLQGLILAVRSYESVTLAMDGKLIVTTCECRSLPFGLKELYLETAPFSLDAGIHKLQLISNSTDFPYLPAAILLGRFGMFGDGVLDFMPGQLCVKSFREAGLLEYVGKIVFRRKIDLSEEHFIALETAGYSTSITIGGINLGRRLWQPFYWSIPEECKGKQVALDIELATSIGPLFGDFPGMTKEIFPAVLKNYWPQNSFS